MEQLLFGEVPIHTYFIFEGRTYYKLSAEKALDVDSDKQRRFASTDVVER